MKAKKYVIFLMLIIMLCNPVITTNGARSGLLLWFNIIIPSLLPALILTNIIINTYGNTFKNPDRYIIVMGLLCGYPIGAATIVGLENEHFSGKRQFLMAVCNISSPAFVVNYIIISSLHSYISTFNLLVTIYLPVIILLVVNRFCRQINRKPDIVITASTNSLSSLPLPRTRNNISIDKSLVQILDTSISNGFEIIVKLGGYIILFSILAAFVSSLPIYNPLIKSILIGITEITTGINYITSTTLPINLQALLVCVFNAFGGLSCIAQTQSVILTSTSKTRAYSIKKYIYHKILIAALTAIIGYLMIYVL